MDNLECGEFNEFIVDDSIDYVTEDTTIEEALKLIHVKPDMVKDHPKVKAFIQYVKDNDLYLGETNVGMNSDDFIRLVEGIQSFTTLSKILAKPRDFLSVSSQCDNMIKWYNIYNPEKLDCIFHKEEASILIDKEYFKYASVEWTEDIFQHIEKVLVFNGDKYELQDNPLKEDDNEYIDSYSLNVSTLYYAKKNGTLKEAIETLMK